jgi:lipooligosaccharide transport system ATP-binding protein
MDGGRFAAEGAPHELITRYSTREVLELRFRDPDTDTGAVATRLEGLAERFEALPDRLLLYTDDGEATLAEVHRLGLSPDSTLIRRSTLEDVFLRLTGRSLVD